jgi:hypothetical protein
LRAWMFIHGQNIYIHIYYANKRPPATFIYPEFCLPPFHSAIRKSRLTFFRAGGLIAALPYSQTQT